MKNPKTHSAIFLMVLMAVFTATTATFATVYIDKDAIGSGTGDSWANAATTIQQGIDLAAAKPGGDEVWVMKGTYAITATIVMKSNVHLYGGFAGTEASVGDRDLDSNVTTIDAGGGDFVAVKLAGDYNAGTNRYPSLANTVLDGFTITGSNRATLPAAGTPEGGGIFISDDTNPQVNTYQISNCTITGNTGWQQGGGFWNYGAAATFSNCVINANEVGIEGNTSTKNAMGGGGFANLLAVTTFDSCTISSNVSHATNASWGGGGIGASGATLNFVNSVIHNNTTSHKGGAIGGIVNPKVTLINCTVTSNTADNQGGGVHLAGQTGVYTFINTLFDGNGGTGSFALMDTAIELVNSLNAPVIIDHCLFNGNRHDLRDNPATYDGASTITLHLAATANREGVGNVDGDPKFLAPTDFHLTAGSAAIDQGTNAYTGFTIPATDIEGVTRDTTYDIGAYEYVVSTSVSDWRMYH